MSETTRKCTRADLRIEHRVWEVSTVDENGDAVDVVECQHDDDCDGGLFCDNCHAEWWDWDEALRHLEERNDQVALSAESIR